MYIRMLWRYTVLSGVLLCCLAPLACVVGGGSELPEGVYNRKDSNKEPTPSEQPAPSHDASVENPPVAPDATHEPASPDLAPTPDSPGNTEAAEAPETSEPATPEESSESTAETSPERGRRDGPPFCGLPGEIVDAITPCCTNLKRAAWAEPPSCQVTPQKWLCVACGDGQCDAKQGENTCNCQVDCKPQPACTRNSDCGKPSCKNSGTTCVLTTPICEQGECGTSSKTQADMICSSQTKCEKRCTRNTDCAKPSCKDNGTTCTQTTPVCQNARCQMSAQTNTNHYCGTSGLCIKRCSKNTDCGKPSCKNSNKDCVQTTPTCTNGVCSNKAQTQTLMQCNATGLCAARACNTVADCGKSTCSQSGATCQGTIIYCLSKICRAIPVTQKDWTCNTSTGLCVAPKSCKTVSDCGKYSCKQNGKLCEQTSPLCTNNICQTSTREVAYATCQSTGLCQVTRCTQVSACGKAFCQNDGNDCKEVVPGCAYNIVCQGAIRTLKNARCNTSTGKCVLQSKCTQNSDCGAPTCLLDNRTCTNYTSTCSNGACQVQTKNATGFCNFTTGKCQ